MTSTGELPGPHSPVVNFSTLAAEFTMMSKLSSPCTSSHSHRNRTLNHSFWQLFPLKQFPDEYCTYMYVVLVMLLGIVISLGIASFL